MDVDLTHWHARGYTPQEAHPIHLLRNPHGHSPAILRDARLWAADELERLHQKPTPTIDLQHGWPLVLVGPQGCGKSLRARLIAAKYGAFAEVAGFRHLHDPFGLAQAGLYEGDIRTLIIDEGPQTIRDLDWLKHFVKSMFVEIDAKGRERRAVRTPFVIVCAQDASAFAGTQHVAHFMGPQ